MSVFSALPSRLFPPLLAIGLNSACNDPSSVDSPYLVTPVTTASMSGTPGWTLGDTLVVEVRDYDGNLVPGTRVHWSLPQGGKLAVQLADADDRMTGTTDSRGRNYAVWTLGMTEGSQVAKVAAGLGEPTAFTASATALHVLQVTVGEESACAILTDQRPVCWGGNYYGELGVGDLVDRSAPTPVEGLTAVLQIVGSPNYHTCARDLSGDVWCWGSGATAQTGSLAALKQTTPVRVPGAAGATDIGVGYNFSCAILAVGGARCWGSNDGGRLGIGGPSFGGTTYPNPVAVAGGSGFRSISLTYDRACSLDSNGDTWCWGNASGSEFAPAPPAIYYAPIQPVPGYKFSAVTLTWWTNCGIAVGGVALCWGNNFGLGYDWSQSTPAPISPRVEGPFAQIAADQGTFFGRSRDGRLLVWGNSDCCGSQTFGEVPLPVRAIDVSGGGYGYCIIAESGALYCDRNNYGSSGLKAFPAIPES